MYAVILSGGKQYRVQEGQFLDIDKIDTVTGADVEFSQVLLVGEGATVKVGAPYVVGCKVVAVVEDENKLGRKILGIKFKRRKHHMKRWGHRQKFTRIRITAIQQAA